jgi:hypothetical protein
MLFLVTKHTSYGSIEIGLIEAESQEALEADLYKQARPEGLMGVAFTYLVAPVGKYLSLPRR